MTPSEEYTLQGLLYRRKRIDQVHIARRPDRVVQWVKGDLSPDEREAYEHAVAYVIRNEPGDSERAVQVHETASFEVTLVA